MSGIDRTRGRIVTASARRRGQERIEMPQYDHDRRHSNVHASEFLDTGSYDLRRHSTVGPSDFGQYTTAAPDLPAYHTPAPAAYDAYYHSGGMTGFGGTSYGYQYYPSQVGPSSGSFHYQFYPTEAGPSGTTSARPSFALSTPIARGADRDTDDHDVEDDDENDDDEVPRPKRDRKATFEWQLTEPAPGGPHETSLLTGFAGHVAFRIWNGDVSICYIKFF